jgi:hypothetical protein
MRLVHAHTPDTGDHRSLTPSSAIASEITLTGSACLTAVMPQEWLDAVREYADRVATGAHEVMLEGADATALPFVQALVSNPDLLALLESVAQIAHPSADTSRPDIECALRVINGADPMDRPLWFHYDASVLTVVLPIVIPDAGPGQSGELILCPDHRPYRRWALANVIEKAITQSDAYRRRFLRRLNWHRDTEVVPLQPGNAYLFWGYRSYHATMPVAPDSKRVTVILHYRDVHQQSRILKYAKAFHQNMRTIPTR